jgi:hypothetical protein
VCGFFARTHSPRFTCNSPTRLHRLAWIYQFPISICLFHTIDRSTDDVCVDRSTNLTWVECMCAIIVISFVIEWWIFSL